TCGPAVRVQPAEDRLLRPPLRDPPPDQRLHLLRDRRGRLVERLVADRADELRLDRSRARTAPPPRPRDDPEGQGGDRERPHPVSARRMWAASSASVIGPTTCA